MNLTLARKHLGTLWLLLLFFATGISWAQVSIGSLPYTKTDNFNSYNGSGPAALPTGWTMLGATNYRGQGTGTSNTGGFYAFGSGSDYSLGALRSSSNNYTYAVSFTNNTGSTITQLVISWNYEQWRYANTSGWDCTGTGALASNATLNGKDFVGSASGTSGSVTTTAVASFTLSGLSIANGQTFGIQWVTTDQGSSDNGVSIDDFSLQASGSGGPQNQTITFNALTSQTYGVAPYLLSATSTSGLTVSFASSNTNVAQISGNTITIVGAGSTNITASQAGNAGFNPATNVVRALTVNPKTITATGAVASDKSYDRSTSANITGAIAQGLVGTDEITVTGGGNFDDFNVGDNKPVTAALTLSGTKASSYTLTQPVGLSASITPKDLTIAGAAVANKPYDGNTSATLIGTLNGVISPDDVVLSALASFEFPFAGTGIPAISEAFLVGADIANYNLVQPTGLAADITPKQLTVVGALALNKVYDGNTDAVITGTLDGVIAPDEVIFNGVGIFESPNVGTEIPVESVSFLTGDIANYELVQPTGLFATISAEALLPQEITFNPLADAYYGDANFNLDATASSALAVTYASSDENIATVSGHTVTVVGVGSTIITAMQSGDSTYDMAIPVSQTLNVLPKELTIANLIVSDKIYDGTDAVSLSADLEGVVGSEDVTLIFTAAFSSVNVGTDVPVNASFSLQGNDIANYTLTQPTDLSADITAKTLTIDSVVANDKPYDGSTAATLSNITFSGNVAGDDVTLSGNGQFADANAAQDIAVTVTLALDGAQAGNYSFTQPAGLSADITPLVLTISGLSVEDKIYDATDAATLNGSGTLEGVINAEDVTLGGSPSATFNNASVGVNKPVTIAGFTLSGTGAQNYTLEGAAGLTADITAKSVTVSGAVANAKPYDGTTAATLSDTGVLSGVEPTDEGQVSVSNVATFASSAIGNNIAVTLALTGTKAPNYSLTQPGITASITAGPCAPSTVTWNFNTASPSSAAVANLSVSALSQGNNNGSTTLITSTSASNNAGASGGNNAGAAARTGALSLATSAYFEFSLTPATGYTARLTGINFGSRSTGTGPQAYAIRSSLDNYATNLASAFMSANSTWSAHTPSLTATSGNPGTQVTYRIYGYNGTGSPASGTANWRIDDLNLAVTVAAGLSSSTSATACSGSQFDYQPTSAASGASFSWTRAAVTGIDNPAVTSPQDGAIAETLVNTTASAINVVYVYQVAAGTCYAAQNVTVQVLPGSLGGTVDGGTAVCAGANNTTLTLSGQRGVVVRWESSTTADFTENLTPIAHTSTTYNAINVATGTYYRAVVSNGGCAEAFSAVAFIGINELFPFYTDADGDGYGTGEAVMVCAVDANTPPTGYAAEEGDCDDQIAAINPGAADIPYNGVDDDCDGTIDETGTVTTTLLSSSCGVTLASINSLVGIQTVGGHQITGYRIRITNGSEVQTIEKNVPHFTIPQFPSHAYATTYTVEIQLQRAGIWQASWGTPCLVSTPAILVDGGAGSVNPSQCGITLASINTLIATTSLQGVTGYRFRISDLTNPTGPNAVQTIDRTQNWFSLQMLARYNYGTEYRIEVAVKTTGTFGGYGAACELSSPAAPTLVNCGGTVAAKHTPIASTSVSGATQYRFQVVRASDLASATLDRSTNFFNFNMIPVSLYTAGATYNVRVAVMTAGTCSPFGDACEIMAPGAAAKPQVVTEDSSLEAVARISAYPNPFVQDFAIESTGSTQSAMSVKVYDMLGRLVEEGQVGSESAVRFGSQYPSGVYNVIVTNGQNVKTLRMVKR